MMYQVDDRQNKKRKIFYKWANNFSKHQKIWGNCFKNLFEMAETGTDTFFPKAAENPVNPR